MPIIEVFQETGLDFVKVTENKPPDKPPGSCEIHPLIDDISHQPCYYLIVRMKLFFVQ